MINVLIVGAGEAGQTVLNEIINNPKLSSDYNVVGFADDKVEREGDFPVLCNIDGIRAEINKHSINEIVIAIPSADTILMERILSRCGSCGVQIKIVPCIYDIINGDFHLNQVREIKIEDLLGRQEVGFKERELIEEYRDQTILVTGGGGSIGREIVKQLLILPVKKVIALGHGENSLYDLICEVGEDCRFDYIIGDVRDFSKLQYEFLKHKPHRVFHAAAHKHVPLMEKFPDEAVKNNILGTYYCAKAAIIAGVGRFNLVSTDKAVNPTSVMGTTKRIGEIIVHSLNKLSPKTKLSCTRFGNVLGSKGSVVPLFKKQIERGGPVTVTHPDITRFFMSIPEAARLVLKAGVLNNGDLFILEMGSPIKIKDLANRMIYLLGYNRDEISIKYSGLRPGEKLYEELLTKGEEIVETGYDKLLVSIANEDSLSQEEINTLITTVLEACETFNSDKIKSCLKKWVKEFQEVPCL